MTIEVPTPTTDLIAQIETATIEAKQTGTAAISAIRERFACYAKHNGYVRIAHYEASTCNWEVDKSVYYRDSTGKKVKAILACDGFSRGREDQNSGSLGGERLYLLATGEWLEIKRVGSWSAWQGSPNQWGCGVEANPNDSDEYDEPRRSVGYTKIVTDTQVAAEWDIEEILRDLGKSMADMCAKLPERHGRLRARAELAQRIVAALKA